MTSPRSYLVTHGCSLSNLPLFVAAGSGSFRRKGIEVVLARIDEMSATAGILRDGTAELGTAPFVQPLVDAEIENAPIMVAGSGLRGIGVLSQGERRIPEDLRGARIGTFRGDPMEVLLHDWLRKNHLGYGDFSIRYLDTIDEAVHAWKEGGLDILTLAEPFLSRLVADGADLLTDGTELWGADYPDTVLVASKRLLAEEPHVVEAVIEAILEAETEIHADPFAAVEHALPYFPGFSARELVDALRNQPPCVDIRHLTQVVFDRWTSLGELGLVTSNRLLPPEAIDFSLLHDTIRSVRK